MRAPPPSQRRSPSPATPPYLIERCIEHVMVDLASKLDAVLTHDGQTLLDHSLITLTSEAGQVTHNTGCELSSDHRRRRRRIFQYGYVCRL